MSIEREQPSTAFRSMPHLGTFDVKPQPIDELTGTIKALNETTNFRPAKGESSGIVHPDFKSGYDPDPVGSLSGTFGGGDPRILGPISGEGPFKPQGIDAKGSVIVGDNHFTPDRGGDSITGEGRPNNVCTNGSATSFLDRLDVGPVNKTTQDWVPFTWFGSNKFGIVHPDFRNPEINSGAIRGLINLNSMWPVDELTGISDSFGCGETNPFYAIWQDCNDVKSGQEKNDLMFQMRENIDWTATNGGLGSSYMPETFEPMEAMTSFAGSFNPVPEDEGFQPREGASVEIGEPPEPKLWLQMLG